jgi:hypothetical protein
MSYPNEDYTVHVLNHLQFVEGCEYCEQRRQYVSEIDFLFVKELKGWPVSSSNVAGTEE